MPAARRSPRLGYALAALAAAMWAVNGSMAALVLDDGVSAFHLSQLRSTLSFLLLLGFLVVRQRDDLRIAARDARLLAWLGVAGLAGTHATYFLAIERLDVGVALAVQYLGPLLLLLWLRFAHRQPLAPSLWGAVGLSAIGSALVVQAYEVLTGAGGGIDGLGLVFAFGAAITFALYMQLSERAGTRHAPHTTLTWAFGFATLFWLVARPPWTFPFEAFDSLRPVVLTLGVAIVGTLVPFVLMVTALRHIAAPRAGVIATLEPVLAALIAWPVLGQTLGSLQIAGGLVVVAAVIWVQSHRPQVAVESHA